MTNFRDMLTIQNAVVKARQRTGDNKLGVNVEAGVFNVVRVERVGKSGSKVETLHSSESIKATTDWLAELA